MISCQFALLGTCSGLSHAVEAPITRTPPNNITSLPVIQITATKPMSLEGPTTIVPQRDMLAFGDQSVNDTLKRMLGLLNYSDGKNPRSITGTYTILINGDPVQNSSQTRSAYLDSITPNMLQKIEIIRQSSVAYSNQDSLGIINIVLKAPPKNKTSGLVKGGYGYIGRNNTSEEKSLLNLQFNGSDEELSYGTTINASKDQIRFNLKTTTASTSSDQDKTVDPETLFASARLEYRLTEQSKVNADISYRDTTINSQSENNHQKAASDNVASNLRYEHKDGDNLNKFRLWLDHSDSTLETRRDLGRDFEKETVQGYGFNYDQERKLNPDLLLKLGASIRHNSLDNGFDQLEEINSGFYGEASWRFAAQHNLTLGLREELLRRTDFADFHDDNLGAIAAYTYQFSPALQMQLNLKKSSRTPSMEQISLISRPAVDQDSGTLNNPIITGNPLLTAEKISGVDANLIYKTQDLSLELNPFYKHINRYIENTIVLEDQQYYLRPENKDKAQLTGINASGKVLLKQTASGHSFRLNGQLSTNRAVVTAQNNHHYLAYGLSPYSFNIGLQHDYKPQKINSSLNFSYLPEYTRIISGNQAFLRRTSQLAQLDFSVNKELAHQVILAFTVKNILLTHQKSMILDASDHHIVEQREMIKAPNLLLTLEKKF